jgi:uncharacterized membrane protein
MRQGTFTGKVAGALMAGALAAFAVMACASPAAADFRLCNNTASRVGVAVGYKDADGWTTEGWWNLPARTCETVLKGNLVARYYYVYAIDYDRGGEWMGQAYMCTRDNDPRHRRLPGARLRPQRFFRGRHRGAARLDRATY